MPYGTVNADLITTSDGVSSAGVYGFKNRLINSDMRIDQRNAGASVTATSGVLYTIDRWFVNSSQASKFTVQRNAGSVTPPAGFTNYLGATSSSAYSVLTSDYFALAQAIEGLNVADLGWGTANAQTITVSFWVRSSLTGTFGGSLNNSAGNRSYPFTYTITAANTWEQKSVTIAGDTSGTWLTTNGVGLYLVFSLGAGATFSGTAGAWAAGNFQSATGATSVVGTNGATFYITGVQLEKGSTATSFDYRPYELSLCQRYYWKTLPAAGGVEFCVAYGFGTTGATGILFFPVSMRIAPTALEQTGTAGDYRIYRCGAATNTTCSSVPVFGTASTNYSSVVFTVASGLTNGSGGSLGTVNSSAYLAWSSEL